MSSAFTIAGVAGRRSVAAAVALALAASAAAQPAHWTDPAGDAVARPTDSTTPLLPAGVVVPDLLSVTLRGWEPSATSIYSGRSVGPGGAATTLRLDVVFAGLVNPPGGLGFLGTYDAYRFGPSPVFGFLELDVDRDADTGGELPGAAELRYLANVARFGSLPTGAVADRAARTGFDLDRFPNSPPQYERSGEDFSLVLCGCHETQVVQSEGNDMVFSAGETWIVRSRFFQRAGGYAPVSAVVGGSNFGEYDPMVDLRFRHDIATDTTTITLVYALDEHGAARLAGQPVQPIDPLIGFGSHASVVEALQDLVLAADNPPLNQPLTVEMLEGWSGRDPRDYLDPTQWHARAIFGTTYAYPSDGLYIWTDVGFGEVRGDVNGDGSADETDNDAILQAIASQDGGPMDADGAINNGVHIIDFGYNFSVYDVDGNGIINRGDLNVLPRRCLADWNNDDRVEIIDLLEYLGAWFNAEGDTNDDGINDAFDLLAYLDAYFVGC